MARLRDVMGDGDNLATEAVEGINIIDRVGWDLKCLRERPVLLNGQDITTEPVTCDECGTPLKMEPVLNPDQSLKGAYIFCTSGHIFLYNFVRVGFDVVLS